MSKNGGKLVVELVWWLGVTIYESGFDVLEEDGVWFFMEESGSFEVDVGIRKEVNVLSLGSINGIVDVESKLAIVLEDVVWGSKRKVVVEAGFNTPGSGVKLPVEVFEKVNDGFERVVRVRLR